MQLPEYNINSLADGDLVVYEDFYVELKFNSVAVFSPATMLPTHRLPGDTELKPMTHCVNKGKPSEIRCFIVRTTDPDYNKWTKKD